MTTSTLHPLAAQYLERLTSLAARLPASRRNDIVTEVEAHLQEAIKPGASDSEALTVLDRLGDPEEIIEAEQPQPPELVNRRGTREWAAIFLLLFGGFLAGWGWIVGLVFLWGSSAWTTREKLIGSFVVPGGLALVAVMAVVTSSSEDCVSRAGLRTVCTGGQSGTDVLVGLLVVVLLIAPLASAIFLARRAR
jgi:hypothetical protein